MKVFRYWSLHLPMEHLALATLSFVPSGHAGAALIDLGQVLVLRKGVRTPTGASGTTSVWILETQKRSMIGLWRHSAKSHPNSSLTESAGVVSRRSQQLTRRRFVLGSAPRSCSPGHRSVFSAKNVIAPFEDS